MKTVFGFRALPKLFLVASIAFSGCGVKVTLLQGKANSQLVSGIASPHQSLVTVSSATDPSGTSITVTVRLYDQLNTPLESGGDLVSISAVGGTSTGTLSALTDHGDGTYTATFTGIVAGTPVTIQGAVNGTPFTTVLPTVMVVPGTLSLAASTLAISAPTVASGASATASFVARDAAGNAIPTGGATVVFSASGGTSTGTFSAVTDHGDGTYSATFTGAVAGTSTDLHATVNASAFTGTEPAVTVVAGASSTAQSVVTVSAGSVASAGTVTVTLTVRDAAGNPKGTGGDTVAFSLGGGTSTGTFSAVTDHGDGTYTATFTGVLAGTARTIGASLNAVAVSSSLPTVTVTPGAPSATTSTFTVSQATIQSGNAATITLQAKDAAGNSLVAGGATVAFSASGGTSTGTISAVTDVGNGTYTATFTGVLAGTATTLHATVGGSAVTTTEPTVAVIPGAISPATSLVSVSAATVYVAGTVTVTLTGKDAAGNSLTASGGSGIAFSTTGGTSAGTYSAVTDNADGTYTATFTATTAGTPTTVRCTIGGVAVTTTLPTIDVDPLPPDGSKTTIAKSCGASIVSGATCTFTITARDANNNAVTVGGWPVTVGHSGGVATLSFGAVTDNGNGTYTVVGTGIVAGSATTITGTIDGNAISSATPTVSVTPGALDLSKSTIEYRDSGYTKVVSDVWLWGGTDTTVVVGRDLNGNAVGSGGFGGRTVNYTLGGGSAGLAFIASAMDGGNGTYIGYLLGTAIGTGRTYGATVASGSPSGPLTGTLPNVRVKTPWVSGDLPGIRGPTKVRVRGGKVYISEGIDVNRVQARDLTGTPLWLYGRRQGVVNYDFWDLEAANSLAVDSAGYVLVGDGFGRLRTYDTAGKPIANGYISNFPNFGMDVHPGDDTKVVVAIYQGWSGDHRVYLCRTGGTHGITTCPSYLGKATGSGSADGEFNTPLDAAYDASGNIYVLDSGNSRVQKFDSSGTYVFKFGSAGSGNGQFSGAYGLAVDSSGNIWVADTGNHRIQKFDSTGAFVQAFGGGGIANGKFNSPKGVAVDGSGNIWVADTSNDRVVQLDSSGAFVQAWGQKIDESGKFGMVGFVGSDPAGSVIVPDQTLNSVTKFDGAGNLVFRVNAASGAFNRPIAAAGLSDGTIAVVDHGNARVVILNADGSFNRQFGSFGTGNSQFRFPSGIAVDASDNLYVADSGNCNVKIFTSAGVYVNKFLNCTRIDAEFQLALDGAGGVYVTQKQGSYRNVRKFNTSGTLLATTVANGGSAAQVADPAGIAIDAANDVLYVASTANPSRGAIKVYTLSTGAFVKMLCAGPNNDGFSGQNRMGYGYAFNPEGVAVDPTTGHLYIGDTGNTRVKKIDPSLDTCEPVEK